MTGWKQLDAGRPRVTRALAVLAIGLWLMATTVGGAVVALRAFSPAEYQLGAARVNIATSLSPRGTVDAYIPIVDWGIRAHPFSAPITLSATLVSVDRQAAAGTVRDPSGAPARFYRIEEDAPDVAHSALHRAALVALLGGLTGGLVGGIVLAAGGGPTRMMALGGLAGLGITGAGITACALMLISPDYHAFRTPTFYAHGGELPKLLQVSDKFSAATAEYQSSYEQALSGLDVLIGAAAGQKPDTSKTSFLVGSDVHSNWLTLPAVERYARGRPVFLVGDYSQQGTPLEAAIADRAARLGTPTVAVSGNHDTPGVMRRLAQAGAIVLTHDGRLDRTGHVRGPSVVRIAGALVAAFEDPLERSAGSFGHRLDFTNEELALQKQVVIDWFDRLDPRPDMVMVHDFRIAEALRLHSAAQSDQPVLILTGHDHEQHVDRTRNAVVVDGGTLGAGGVFGVGEQQAGFAQVHLDGTNWPQAVDLISADPISGDASAEHIVLTRLPVGQSEPATPTGQASASAR